MQILLVGNRSLSNSPHAVLLLEMPTDIPSERSKSPTPSAQFVIEDDGGEMCVRDDYQVVRIELAVAEGELAFVPESRWRRCTLM